MPIPKLVRRFTTVPAFAVVAILVATISPVLLVAAFVVDLVAWRRLRLTRFVVLVVVWSYAEVVGILALFFLWLLGGFGLLFRFPFFLEIHYVLLGAWLRVAVKVVRVALGLRIESDVEPWSQDQRVIVFARHAGPADSLLFADAISRRSRNPRIVAKAALQWDPFIDVAANRVPFHFVGAGGAAGHDTAALAELAGGMGSRDAFLIFPEGGNFTSDRRDRAISSLEAKGLEAYAEAAKGMSNVLPPRPGGALAVLEAAPDAEVVFVAHTGTEHVQGLADVWRAVPFGEPLRVRTWVVPPSARPPATDREATIEWLFRWWGVVDGWIGEIEAMRLRRRAG